MKATFAPPCPDSAGPRRPQPIRVSHSDPYRDQPASDYLSVFEASMTRAFLCAFRQAERRGRL